MNMNHMSFTVSDLDRAVAFYRDAVGLSLMDMSERDPAFSEKVTGIPGAHLRIAYLRAGACAVELVQYLAPNGEKADTRTCNVGSAHVCFDVDDLDGTIDRMLTAGGRMAGSLAAVPGGPNRGKRVAYLEDPDGNTVELIENQASGG